MSDLLTLKVSGMCVYKQVNVCVPTQEEEEGSDEECGKEQQPPWFQSPRSVLPDDSADVQPSPPLVSPLEEEKALQPQVATVATLHEASRSALGLGAGSKLVLCGTSFDTPFFHLQIRTA